MDSLAAADEGPYNLRSDGRPGIDGYLGDFCRGPAVFTLYTLGAHPADPHRVTTYLVDVEDGAGPRECCRFTDEPDSVPEWASTWRNDPWCPSIMLHCQELIAHSTD